METKELLALLDLDARADPKEAAAIAAESPLGPTGSPTALEIDAWGLRRGSDLARESERIAALGLDSYAVADCHAAAFDPEPRLASPCRDIPKREFFAALLESPDYRSLHESTKLDVNASEIAALHFAEELARFGKVKDGVSNGGDIERDVAALRAATRAVSAASAEVTVGRDALAALGLGPGCPGSNDAKVIASLFRRVRNDPQLRTICSLAGRYRRWAQSRQRRKVCHGLDDLVGVELSGDLSRVLPHELMKLTSPPFDVEAMRRLIEHQLMSREHRGAEPVAKGPIIVVIDESGSMAGEPVHTAKAIALALAWIARQQRRWCALVAYSGDSGERLLPLPPGRWNEEALADWLIAFLGRGSTLDVPIRELPRLYVEVKAPVGATDIIAITDCVCQIPADARDAFNAWKKAIAARMLTLVIGSNPGDLQHVSDEVHVVRSLAVGEEAVGRALAI